MDANLESEYIPKTFAERGVAVPFTTPMVVQARVRLSDGGMAIEFTLPAFSGGRGRYVMHWSSIASTVTLTMHDRTLYKYLTAETVKAPPGVRTAALHVALKGMAGPKAARRAREVLGNEAQYRVLTNFILVQRLMEIARVDTARILTGGIDSEESQRLAKKALGEVAGVLSVPPTDLYSRVEVLSSMITPVGLPWAPGPGRLRALVVELESFHDSLKSWTDGSMAEIASLGTFCADVAAITLELLRETLAGIDAQVSDLRALMREWDQRVKQVHRRLARMEWLLDGWGHIIHLWSDANEKGDDARLEVMVDLFRLLPIVPKKEYQGIAEQTVAELDTVQRRWVRPNQDWRAGRLDFEAVRQIESLKARVR